VVGNKTKLVGVLFEEQPKVLFLGYCGPNSEKVLTSNDAIERAVRKEMLLISNASIAHVITKTMFSMEARRFGSQSSVSLHPQ